MNDIKWSPPLPWKEVYNLCVVGRYIRHTSGQAFRVGGKFPDEAVALSWLRRDGTVDQVTSFSLKGCKTPHYSVEMLAPLPLEDFL